MWTSRATEAYFTVTGHIIDENWEMQAYVLETSSFSGNHRNNICLMLKRITDEWGLTVKIQAIVTDNGANVVSAVRKAGWAHYPCFAHTINLTVKDSIKALPELLFTAQKQKRSSKKYKNNLSFQSTSSFNLWKHAGTLSSTCLRDYLSKRKPSPQYFAFLERAHYA